MTQQLDKKTCGVTKTLGGPGNSYEAVCAKSARHEDRHGTYFATDKLGEFLCLEWDEKSCYFSLVKELPAGIRHPGPVSE